MTYSMMNMATASEVAFHKEIASAHLVKFSVVVRIHIRPWDGGVMGPIRSNAHVWKGQGALTGCKVTAGACILFPKS